MKLLLFITLTLQLSPLQADDRFDLAKPSISKTEAAKGDDTDTKVQRIPRPQDDKLTEELLNGLLAQAGWFPDITIKVNKGLAVIEGRVQNKDHLQWLIDTADRLPTVVAVINKATIEEPPVSDLTPALKEVRRMIESAKKSLPTLGIGFALLALFIFSGSYMSKFSKSFWNRRVSNPFLASTVNKLMLVPLYMIMLYLVLSAFGLSGLASTIIGGTGVIGIVLGFAFKGIAENFLSGILLAIRSPFTKGDQIKIGEYTGYVQNLNMRGTTIMDLDGNLILIPNSIVVQSVVMNASANSKARTWFVVTIGYRDSVENAESIIRTALCKLPDVLNDPPLAIGADTIGPAGINLKVFYWIDSAKSSSVKTKSKAIAACKSALLENNFDLPDEKRETIFKTEHEMQNMIEHSSAKSAPIVDKKSIPPPTAMVEKESEHPEERAKQALSNARLPSDEKGPNLLN